MLVTPLTDRASVILVSAAAYFGLLEAAVRQCHWVLVLLVPVSGLVRTTIDDTAFSRESTAPCFSYICSRLAKEMLRVRNGMVCASSQRTSGVCIFPNTVGAWVRVSKISGWGGVTFEIGFLMGVSYFRICRLMLSYSTACRSVNPLLSPSRHGAL